MPERDPMAAGLMDIYERFYAAYGPQHWWPGDGPFEVIAGAILTQSAAWANVVLALTNMRAAGCWSLKAVHQLPVEELAELVRSSGYFNAKARKLKAFAAHVATNYQGDLDRFLARPMVPLREELLSIHGIGEETADDILVYAAGKPSFVIDTYTRRIMDRMGMTPARKNPVPSTVIIKPSSMTISLTMKISPKTPGYTTSSTLYGTATPKRPAPKPPAAKTAAS